MRHWTRSDRVLAYVRLVRVPVTLKDITEALDDDMFAVSATVSKLTKDGELNRTRSDRGKFLYTDPAYDELLGFRRQAREQTNAL
jgi:transcription initiation factor TFIIIB Brf1 subunit/transcription initiation factor TFIIB